MGWRRLELGLDSVTDRASGFNAVIASATNNVWTMGAANGQSLIERWNGRV